MKFLRPLLGLALLAGLIGLTEPQTLLSTFQRINLKLFGMALALAIVANFICVYRWQVVAQKLGIQASYRFLLTAYAQGISANSVLPGGIVGGDAWRSLVIAKQTATGSKATGILSVLLDRVSGFWGLTWLSLAAGIVATLIGESTRNAGQGWFDSSLGRVYLVALMAITLAPILGQFIHLNWLRHLESNRYSERVRKWLGALIQIINSFPILKRTVLYSLVIQILSATGFWLCLISVDVNISWWLLTSLCGGIFLSGILPAALGGFGARELGAVAFITPFGFSKEGVLAGSVLFGLTATIQGILGLWFWFRSKAEAGHGA
jgi:glycosyltransferase 2 family protein